MSECKPACARRTRCPRHPARGAPGPRSWLRATSSNGRLPERSRSPAIPHIRLPIPGKVPRIAAPLPRCRRSPRSAAAPKAPSAVHAFRPKADQFQKTLAASAPASRTGTISPVSPIKCRESPASVDYAGHAAGHGFPNCVRKPFHHRGGDEHIECRQDSRDILTPSQQVTPVRDASRFEWNVSAEFARVTFSPHITK